MSDYSHQNNSFSTSDLFLASFLRLSGCQLLGIDKRDPKRVKFIFDSSAEEKALDYFNGATIEACRLASAVAECRHMLFDMD